ENCVFENPNQYALVVNNRCSRISVPGCEFRRLGAGGIAVHGANSACDPESYSDATSKIVITDNHVHDCGLVYPESVGILITNAFGNLVEHNHIHDLNYSGISCGWNWGSGESSCRENRIGFNLVHDIGQGVMSDMGGIYMLGIQPGTRIYNNVIHHVAGRLYGGWGIYLDAGSAHMVVERNICHDNGDDGFHLNFGRENIVRDNIFALNNLQQFTISELIPDLRHANPGTNLRAQASVYRNLLITDGRPFYKMSWPKCFSRDALYSDSNFYWSTDPTGLPEAAINVPHAEDQGKPKTYTMRQWQGFGHDMKSGFEDPLVADIAKRDFRLKPDSPLLKAGFPDTAETIEKAGIRKRN
ncbi:MAG: right-handed parallel beta-helix repeat-containing protein, partial [Victivallaceae bacterium]|nr:right-handed parallel beta-helix repeat-containing protein [Victivallaceae bacterium]